MNDNWGNMYSEGRFHKPDLASAMGLLSHLNVEELREVLNDEKKFEELIKDVKELKDIETEKEILIASNRSLAEFNLSREPDLLKEKQEIQELSETGEAIYQRVEEKSKQFESKPGCQNLDTALALLQTAAAEMEEESEAVAEKFMEGQIDVDQFLEQFTSRRKLMHLRKVKMDKMSEMVNRRTTHQFSPLNNRNINSAQPVTQGHHLFYQPPQPPAPVTSNPPTHFPYPVTDLYHSQSFFG